MKKISTLIIITFITITINAQTTKQRLDSIMFQDYHNEEWITSKSYIYSYDDLGHQTQEKYLTLNDEGGMSIWKQMDYDYNEDHRLSQYILSSIDENSYLEIKEIYKEELDYYENGLLKEKTIFLKNSLTFEWELENKINYLYDEFNNIVSMVDSIMDLHVSGEFEPNTKDDFTYNAQNKLINHINSDWWNDTYWKEHEKDEYSYSENGRLIQKIEFNKFGSLNWKEEKKTEYTYDDLEDITQKLISSFSDVEGWVLDEKLEYSYDMFNNRIQYLSSSWINNEWVKAQKTDWNLNTNYSSEDLILPSFITDEIGDDGFGMMNTYENNFNNMLIDNNISKWNSTTESWTDMVRSTFHFSEIFLHVPNLEKSTISLYPNPATNYIIFYMEDKFQTVRFKLFNINGKLVLSKEILLGSKISVREYKSGMYFYQLTTSTKTIKGKVILQ